MITKEEKEKFLQLLQEKDYLDYFEYVYSVACKTLDKQDLLSLDKFEKSSATKFGFYIVLLTLDEDSASTIINCSKVSGIRIGRLSSKLSVVFTNRKAFEVFSFRENIEELRPWVIKRFRDLNVRIIHSFESYLRDCNDSVLELYFKILISDRDSVKYPSLGRRNATKLFERMQDIRRMIEDTVSVPSAMTEKFLINKWSILNLNLSSMFRLKQAYNRLEYFPLFKAIELIIESYEQRDNNIVNYCFNIFSEEHMLNLTEMAEMNNISRERVRQLRTKNLERLESILSTLYSQNILNEYHYDISSEYELGNISSREDVPFNENFIIWVLSKIYKDYKLLGDVERTFFKYPASGALLFLVPESLQNYFCFETFLHKLEEKSHEKRFYDERIELEIFVRSFCSKDINQEIFYKILRECRRMVERGYPNIINNSQLLYRANSRKPIPDLIEDILRANDEPMTSEEISEKLHSLYPDLEQTSQKTGANALRNPNIVAISRTSTYTLAEWNSTKKRGGTIRDLVQEYLNNLTEPIAPLSEICNYVAKFRTNVKEDSVKANLLAESSNRFSIYYKNNTLYVGYTENCYDDSFIIQDKRKGHRTFKDSIEILENFIKNNDRFPYTSGVDTEELRLSRFWNVSKSNLRKGLLSPEEVIEIERIEQRYGKLRTKKERISWEEHLKRFVAYITTNDKLPVPSSKDYVWFIENKKLFETGKLEPDKIQAFTVVKKIVSRMEQSIFDEF